jgi:molybdopterin-guanine dinucleotide biosynthesis protein B
LVLVIAAVGTSGSGKTTTLEYLIQHLSAEGYKIGSIKHIHHKDFTIDKEGTDTWRHAKAGSKVTIAISPEEIAMITKTNAALNDLDKVIGLLEGKRLDIIFIEGFHRLIAKRTDVPKVITAEDEANLKRTLKGNAEPIIAVTGVISKNKPAIRGLKIPIIDLETEGEQLLQLVKKNLKSKQSQPDHHIRGKTAD